MNFIKNINWRELITTDFWFAIDRTHIHPSEKAFIYIGLAFIVLGIIFLVYARLTKNQFLAKVSTRFAKIFLTTGIVEGIWYAMRTQYAQVLGTKFVAALILLLGIIWLIGPIKYLIKHYKVDMAVAEREASRQKYLNQKRK
jgi:hypothetical protein